MKRCSINAWVKIIKADLRVRSKLFRLWLSRFFALEFRVFALTFAFSPLLAFTRLWILVVFALFALFTFNCVFSLFKIGFITPLNSVLLRFHLLYNAFAILRLPFRMITPLVYFYFGVTPIGFCKYLPKMTINTYSGPPDTMSVTTSKPGYLNTAMGNKWII